MGIKNSQDQIIILLVQGFNIDCCLQAETAGGGGGKLDSPLQKCKHEWNISERTGNVDIFILIF